MERKAIGIVRVSRLGDREAVSPDEQRERIRVACERDGLTVVHTFDELDVSGGAALEKRPGLRRAVEAIEAGEADVVAVAYFDRLFRSLPVQAEVVQRVEAAGGKILAADTGQLTNGSAGSWITGTMLGMVAEYHRRATAERTSEAKRRAIARGVPTFPNIPPGLRQLADGRLEPDPETAPIIVGAFRLRADGATIREVRAFLREHGIRRSPHGVQSLLSNRMLLGELRFGDDVNLAAFPPVVPRELFAAVQKVKAPRGRRPTSDALLARLGVLRCATCGARMVIGTTRQGGKTYAFYRCPPTGDCPQRVTVSAAVAEAAVVEAVQNALAGIEGTASVGEGVDAAARELERAQDALDTAIRAFAPVMDEPTARERLEQLREARDEAQAHLDRLSVAQGPAVTVTAGDWDRLSLEGRRDLIRAVVVSATVAPGRGPNRVTVQLLGQQPAGLPV